jgi:predicted acetyltransferase
MWRRLLKDASQPTAEPFGAAHVVAVHTDPAGVDDGYVHYVVKWNDRFAENPVGIGTIEDLRGASPEVELELWRYLVDIDLITSWTAETRPVDEPVRRAMHDSRAYEVKRLIDDQWVRLLDVDVALSRRTFGAADAPVSLAVIDPMFADNNGTWIITSDGARRSDAPPDLTVDTAALSAAYLGAVSWRDLAASAQVDRAVDATLLDRLDGLFAVRPAPYCGTGY